ncbi:MAG: TrkA family potassium uptake protein [Bacilli bacterium]|nr:TrkA family potassium uptake protein [Bacilli bacterium]
MKIAVAGGTSTAEYIIRNFKSSKNELTVINDDKDSAEQITKNNKVPVFLGDPSKKHTLENAHIEGYDIFISVNEKDSVNFVACLLAKKVFGVKKCICIVSNPNNVEVFKSLGIDSVISSTQLLISSLNSETSLETLIKTMSFEDDKIVLTEVQIKPNYEICNKHIFEISFPKTGSIACIYRNPRVVIPNGQTMILPKDKLLFVSSPSDQQSIVNFITKQGK